MQTVFTHIRTLVQVRPESTKVLRGVEMCLLPVLHNAYMRIGGGRITEFGPMEEYSPQPGEQELDCSGRTIFPTWCDSHTHLVFAGNREQEFADRIRGLSYEEIAQRGGGILNSARTLQACSEEELYAQSEQRLLEVMESGTGAIEIKSGYGLTTEAELKMLRVIKKLREHYPIPIKATYLAAHALPPEFKGNSSAYIDHVISETLPRVAAEGLADYIDIFCEKGYFTVEDMDRLLEAAASFGLVPKVHLNQFNILGGVANAVKHKALSIDHLELMNEEDLHALEKSNTIPVALPLCSFFLSIPYTPGRAIIDRGLPLALATDYNPGSSPSGNMNLVVSTACIKMKLTPEEAINAATINAAYAMGLENEAGSITVGKRANFMISRPIPSYSFVPYNFGTRMWDEVWIEGKRVR